MLHRALLLSSCAAAATLSGCPTTSASDVGDEADATSDRDAPDGGPALDAAVDVGEMDGGLDAESELDAPRLDATDSAIGVLDTPPAGEWMRVGVHYGSAAGVTTPVRPTLRVLCDGGLFAELGPHGYGSPSMPVAFAPSDGVGPGPHRFWLAADVAWLPGPTGNRCLVRPLFADTATRAPSLTTDAVAEVSIGPAYLPAP